eukprot:CAMPEP_0202901448 /NCGR_PEP_ID=MMETSP1392-20130828/14257_1 /ASSEMBLY_ACC=CAM_ASM_000868 /TAXON_ID=225041 /ORGANISM="Chlamydomonas chlamydogama, Strain SAG 11-48b" /LENGTH=393 /DNA_ID=CAMNT_0049588009 /DNA_START=96 /DNA_END=1277 /DNA_ORIENTATION=+
MLRAWALARQGACQSSLRGVAQGLEHLGVGDFARHLSSNSVQKQQLDRNEEVVATPFGTKIVVSSNRSAIDLKSAVGVDTSKIQATWPAGATHGTWSIKQSRADKMTGVVELKETSDQPGGRLTAIIPDKWVNVDITTKGAPVSVAKVIEASLAVSSKGGDVSLGTIRAYEARINTMGSPSCGKLQAGELSGSDVQLSTGHGIIDIKRLIGQRVHVHTHDAPVTIRALYAENADISTGGGSVEVDTCDCNCEGNIESEGGPITVHALDGNLNLHSRGGDIDVHLHDKVGHVRISSGGGRVRVAVSPQAVAAVVIMNAGKLNGDAEYETDHRTGRMTAHFKPDPTHKGARWGTLSEGQVIVDAEHGVVEVIKLGWADAVRRKLSQGKQQAAAAV